VIPRLLRSLGIIVSFYSAFFFFYHEKIKTVRINGRNQPALERKNMKFHRYEFFLFFLVICTACAGQGHGSINWDDHRDELLPLDLVDENEPLLSAAGSMFQTAADVLGVELQTMSRTSSQLKYGLVQYQSGEEVCFPISFLPEEYPELNPFNTNTYLVVLGRALAAGEKSDDPTLGIKLEMALIRTDLVDSTQYYGTVDVNRQDHVQAIVGIPGARYGRGWLVFGLYPLRDEQAELFVPYLVLN